jgi:hypothetical protein
MIYSPDHNFLLLKNRKVGGSSLEVELSQVLPNNAIVTPINGETNIWDTKPKNHNERNYGADFFNHIKYNQIEKILDLSNVKTYVFVRHPYNSVLSHFFQHIWFFHQDIVWDKLLENEKNDLLKRYFNDEFFKWFRGDKYLYLDKNTNNVLVDKILYYENGIENEINPILKLHNIPEIKLNSFEKAHRPKQISVKDVFKEEHLEKIRKEWWWEFENLNYQP